MLPTTKRSIDHKRATESELLADYPVTTLPLLPLGAPGASAPAGLPASGVGGWGVGVAQRVGRVEVADKANGQWLRWLVE